MVTDSVVTTPPTYNFVMFLEYYVWGFHYVFFVTEYIG